MLAVVLYCLTMAWDPATGTVAYYNVYLDETLYESNVTEPQVSICLQDEIPRTVTVKAFDAEGNSGPMSDASDAIQMVIESPLYAHPVDEKVRSDINGDGVVGVRDFGLFVQNFGECNDGYQQSECP